MRTTDTTPTLCPTCGELLNAATSPEGAVPKPGDLTMCLVCGAWFIFEQDLSTRPVTVAEWKAARANPKFAEMVDRYSRERAAHIGDRLRRPKEELH